MVAARVRRVETLLQLAVVALLAIGCWRVLEPFFSAILFAIVLTVSTWPAYRWLLNRLGHRRGLAAVIACFLVAALMVAPAALLTSSIGDGVSWVNRVFEEWTDAGGPAPPAWLAQLPLVGPSLDQYWREVVAGEARLPKLPEGSAETIRNFVLKTGRAVGAGVLQLLLALLILHYLYRNGRWLATRTRALATRVGGPHAVVLLQTAQNAVVSVMVGVIGTALAQATVAAIGFAIAGVPNPLLLGAAVFVLSTIPIGPPLIWGGAALWLFRTGETGWAVFMALYGIFAISTVDNIIKPLLISRGARLPFVVTLIGVLGGLVAFGVMGLFLGPTLLALTINLTSYWFVLTHPRKAAPASST